MTVGPIDPNVAQDLARLALDLSHDKKTRKAFAKIVREAKPDSPHAAAFADVEVEDKFEAFKSDYEDGRILYAALNPPPNNTKPSNETPPGATWELPAFAEYSKDPNKAARNNAYAVIDEFRRRRA